MSYEDREEAANPVGEGLKKKFIGSGLHLRPVHADHAWPPFQWILNSVFSAYENTTEG